MAQRAARKGKEKRYIRKEKKKVLAYSKKKKTPLKKGKNRKVADERHRPSRRERMKGFKEKKGVVIILGRASTSGSEEEEGKKGESPVLTTLERRAPGTPCGHRLRTTGPAVKPGRRSSHYLFPGKRKS